ncbi:ABC-type nitrate/sulfonate/bicarbonate transport system, periplasmic component, partial [Mycobacterium numidiamassiliense]
VPTRPAQKYAKAVGLDLKVAELAQSRILRLPIPLSETVESAEQRLADLFAAADQIPEAPDFAKWVDRRFNSVLVVGSTK